ncbi:MAG: hypothetical protein ACI4T5_10435 [Prevotella sp.]
MANSILGNTPEPQPQSQNMGFNPNMIQQIKQFAKTVKGNPKDQVMSMVQQGMRSNEQLQQAMNMARQIQNMFK